MSVPQTLKRFAKKFLRHLGYYTVASTPGEISGISFVDDIRVLVRKEDPVCFDVGANQGQTISLLQRAFKQPRIYAFEPAAEIYQALEAKPRPSRVQLYNYALGHDCSQKEFINYEDSPLSSFRVLEKTTENQFRDVKIKNKQVVDIKTIDWFVAENQIDKIDLLKIDTQGFDLQVLKGGGECFQQGRIKNVFVELNFVKMYENQDRADQISSFLTSHRFRLVDYYEKVHCGPILGWCTALFTTV